LNTIASLAANKLSAYDFAVFKVLVSPVDIEVFIEVIVGEIILLKYPLFQGLLEEPRF
jgi:hypothetical protein